nr:DNA cytosine methyltransferase [uncultured Duganella sp.]
MTRDLITITKEFTHFHFCCGLGGGKQGFNAAQPQVGNMAATLRCIGGIDVDPAAIRDFDRAGPGRPGTVMDLFTRAQYTAFHGKEPPAGWREVSAVDIRRAAGNESPNIVFISSPCKGASGLLSESLSKTAKYQALNELTLRCIWLMAEAWADNPVDLIVFENVPRLATRGRHLLDQINQLLQQFGYAVAETTHDCGEIGGLAQSRKRFLLVARHMEKVPPFLYEPEKKRLRAVGDVLGRMPFPGDEAGGPMHRIPRLQWKTWVRLAFVEAGSDWRSLNRLAVEDGRLSEYLILPERSHDYLGVNAWDHHTGAVSGRSTPTTGAYSVADPRHFGPAKHSNECRVGPWDADAKVVSSAHGTGQCIADPRFDSGTYDCGQYGLCGWDQTMGAVINVKSPGQGTFAVQDPRTAGDRHGNVYRIVPWDRAGGTVTGDFKATSGGGVADPRRGGPAFGKYAVTKFEDAAGTVIAGSTTGQGAYAVADPRSGINNRVKGDAYLTGGHYGVLRWDGQSGAVSASAGYDNGRWSVADPRIDAAPPLPAQNEKTVAIIRALDGTWHRPFTTLELAALQSLIDPSEHWSSDPQTQWEIDEHKRQIGASAFPMLDGTNDSAHRERIGNAVPKLAAQAIGEVMGTTLLLAAAGETFVLSAMPIWVQPVAVALSIAQSGGSQ